MSRLTCCIAALACIAIIAQPNVSFAFGLKRTSLGNQIRWTREDVVLRIDPRLEQMLGGEKARAAAVMASESWRGLPGVPDIAIEQGAPAAYSPDQRGNGIYLADEWPFQDNQLAVTRVTFAQSGEVIGVDILVNGEKSFALFDEQSAVVTTNRYDLAAVLTHEFGHVLGLDESLGHPEATMWPQIHAGEWHQRFLSEDDEDGVIEAYQAPLPAEVAPAIGCSVTTPQAGQAGFGSRAALSLFGLALARTTRRRRLHA